MKINVEVVASKTYKATIDVDAFIKTYENEWMDFIEDEPPDDHMKEEFIKESIHEVGTDFFDVDSSSYVEIIYEDNDLEVDIK